MIRDLLLIGIGGSIGSMLRYLAWYFMKSPAFPIATLFVNITGSLAIGIVIGFSMKEPGLSNNWKLLLATGLCGGFTTFSAFSIENLQLLTDGRYATAMMYIGTTIFTGILAAWAGFKVATQVY